MNLYLWIQTANQELANMLLGLLCFPKLKGSSLSLLQLEKMLLIMALSGVKRKNKMETMSVIYICLLQNFKVMKFRYRCLKSMIYL